VHRLEADESNGPGRSNLIPRRSFAALKRVCSQPDNQDVAAFVWTADELRALVRDRALWGNNPITRTAFTPDWLAEAAGESLGGEWTDQLEAVHPADRGVTVRAYWESEKRPGELVDLEHRVWTESCWQRRRLQLLNLVDQADVRTLLTVVLDSVPLDVADETVNEVPFLSEAPPFVIIYVGAGGNVVRIEGMVERFFGRPADEIVDRSAMLTLDPASHDAALETWIATLAEPELVRSVNLCLAHADGSTRWVTCTVINALAGHDEAVLYVCQDISERLERERALRESQEQFRTLAEGLPDAVFRLGPDGSVEYGNGRWFELVKDLCTDAGALREIVHLDDRGGLDERLTRLLSPSGPDIDSTEVRSADGDHVLEISLRAVGEAGVARSTVVGSVRDATSTAELRHRANHDLLTGALSRDALDRRLRAVLTTHRDDVLVVFVDLDDFKTVNDTDGHDAGDAVLQAVADRLQCAVRPSDDVGRYGGDEFVIICYGAVPGSERGIGARIQAMLVEPVEWNGGGWVPHASVGATRPRAGDTPADVVRRADQSMYRAKRARHRPSTR